MRYWKLIFLPALLHLPNIVSGQYLENYEKKALAAFHSKDYASAMLYSEKVLEVDSDNIASLFVAGESARLAQDYQKAESFLERIPDAAKVGYYAVTDFQLASVKLDLHKIEEAKYYYQKYLNEHDAPNNLFGYLAAEALKSLEKGELKSKKDLLALNRLPDNINSAAPELAPLRYADKIYFTSVTEVSTGKKNKKVQSSRIFEARLDYPAKAFEGNPEKQSLNAGNISLTPDAGKVYYTLCSGSTDGEESCEIWYREHQYEGDWGVPKRLPETVNRKGFSATQPSIAWDKKLNKYALYFVSERPGGRGKQDIWCSIIGRDGTFGEPVCLPFNTPEDDITPFFHQSTQTLFFSSNGWPGIGGFDIFRESKTANGEWNVPENLGEMLNSPFDDTYYTFHTQSRNAYFVSNRPGSKCPDPKQNEDCFDIYETRIFAELNLKTFRSLDNKPVYAPQIDIKELGTAEKGSFAARNDENSLQVRLETGKRYQFTVIANGYDPFVFEFSTEDISYFIELDRQIFLRRPIDP